MKKSDKEKTKVNQTIIWSILLFVNIIYAIIHKLLLHSFTEQTNNLLYESIYQFLVIPILFLSSSAIVGLLIQPILGKEIPIKRKKIYVTVTTLFIVCYLILSILAMLNVLPLFFSEIVLKFQVVFLFIGALLSTGLSKSKIKEETTKNIEKDND